MHRQMGRLMTIAVVVAMATGVAVAEDDAIKQTGEDFKKIVDGVDTGISTIDEIRSSLWDARQYYEKAPGMTAQERRAIIDKISQAQEGLETFNEPLRKFSKMAAPVGSAFDVYGEIKDLKDAVQKAQNREGGPLGGQLQALATIMEKAGGNVPVIGPFIEQYGKITDKLLDATDRVAKTIDENRNQGVVGGPGYYKSGADKEKYDKMVEQFGQDFAQRNQYWPDGPSWIYKPFSAGDQPTLVWDEQQKSWYQIDSSVPVDQIYKMNLLAGKSRTPWEMKVLGERWDSAQGRMKTANGMSTAWEKIYSAHLWDSKLDAAFSGVNSKYDHALSWWQDHPEEFMAKYTYDASFKNQMNEAMKELYKAMLDEGATNAAEYIKEMGEKHGFSVPTDYDPNAQQPDAQQPDDQQPDDQQPDDQQPDDQQPDDQQVDDQQPDDQQPGDEPPVDPTTPVVNSVCFLVDCSGSMAGSKIQSAREAVKSSVAATGDGQTEWALLGFGACNAWQVCGFTRNPADITSSVGGLSASGDTPLNFSIYVALKYLTDNGSGQNGKLIILCDGQDNCDERGSNSHPDAMANMMKMVKETGL
ncbi:MAG: vWA domain-containing protein [Armatimonadota bacterium]